MNIQNITALTQMLMATGFEEAIGYRLMQFICFKPADFTLTERLLKGKDILTCSIFVERKGDEYTCNYYDASFLKAMEVPDHVVHAINLRELDQRMNQIDWEVNEKAAQTFRLSDESSWQREKLVEKVVADLSRLSVTSEGKHFADCLKLKHWSCISNTLVGNINTLRSRFEVNQRFYFFDGQGISIEEAHRFLLNRWLEKKLNAKRKQENDEETETSGGNGETTDKSLLKKKRRIKGNKIKR